MTTPLRKRRETLKNKLLALLTAYPGTLTKNIPKAQRYLLRPLELEKVIEYRDATGGWYMMGGAPS